MRIGTYNVLGFQGYPADKARDRFGGSESEGAAEYFANVFAELGCDILALQEGVSPRQIRRVCQALGCHAATFPSPEHWPGHLLTRSPILQSRIFSHPAPWADSRPFSRSAGAAQVQIGAEERPKDLLWVLGMHLHPSSRELRNQEAVIVRDRAGQLLADTPNVIILGDFNSPVEEPVHRALREMGFINAMNTAGGGVIPTMDTAGIAPAAIDHIYLSPALAPYLRKAEVVRRPGYRDDVPAPRDGTWVHSDHLPVIAELEL